MLTDYYWDTRISSDSFHIQPQSSAQPAAPYLRDCEYCERVVGQGIMSTRQDFPNEILGLVFEQLYLMNRQPNDGSTVGQETQEMIWECADFKSPNVFPWILFHVCQRWGDVAAWYPHFWTRLSFDLASPEVLPLTAFEWSKDYMFEALVFDSRLLETTQSSEMLTEAVSTLCADEDAALERKHVEAITRALHPHLPRCTSLEYDVNYGSSLPHLPFLITHNPIRLTSIELKHLANANDVPRAGHTKSASLGKAVTLAPFSSLNAVSLSVAAFISVEIMDYSNWDNTGHDMTLELYNYQFSSTTSSENFGTVSIAEFLQHLKLLTPTSSLKLRNLSVCSPPEAPISNAEPGGQLDLIDLYFSDVLFENLSRQFLDQLFELCSITAEVGDIKDCKLPKNARRLEIRKEFSFHNLRSDAKPGRVVKDYLGSKMWFYSCHYLDDQVIQLLADRECPEFDSLHLINCDGYSIQALKELVIARDNLLTSGVVQSGIDWDIPMHSIYLRGGPKPSPQDVLWFSQNLILGFHYSETGC